MNNKKIVSVILVFMMCMLPFNQVIYAHSVSDIDTSNVDIKETDTTTFLKYKEIENGKMYTYDETIIGTHVHTKKYNQDILIDEFDSYINKDSNGNIHVQVIKDGKLINSVEVTKTIRNEDHNINTLAIVPSNRKHHPDDKEYVFTGSSSGHLGFKNLTRAVIIGALTTLLTGGNVKGGSVAGAATLIANGGYRNVYYTEETYYPYGTDMKGRPLWKKIFKLYSGNDKNHLIEIIKTDSDLVVTYWCKIKNRLLQKFLN